MKELKLYPNADGTYTDGEGKVYWIPQKEDLAIADTPYRVSASLDMVGDITLTGNLTVQQSDWVYLRGPITGSAALINGPITGSNLLIRKSRGFGETNEEWGRVEVEGQLVVEGVNLLNKIRELEWKLNHLMSGSGK